jgi:hypothetical protein
VTASLLHRRKKAESFIECIPKKLSSLWKREAGRDFWEGSFKNLN